MENSLVPDLVAVLAVAGLASWLFQRIGVSRVLGYLVAGVVVGPFTRPVLVGDIGNIHTLADIGLVFVMFFIGLELSIKRLRALGITPIVVTLLTALFLFNGTRMTGGLFGFDRVQSLFIAGTIMIASSVIVSRNFADLNVSREPFARTAMGVMLLEDAVAIAMLAILGSVASPAPGSASGAEPDVAPLIVRLAGFVLLAVIVALLFVPKLLDYLEGFPREIMNVALGALLLGIAFVASCAGYSLALGAFLLGSVVGGTRYKERFRESFEGLHDIFAAVFYVSMGMLFDVSMALKALPMALGLAAAALAGRSLAATTAFLIAGKKPDFAIRAGFSITPLGEFAFVIAQMGAASGRMPDTFFPGCVGAVFLTTLASPYLCRLGGVLAPAALRHTPQFLASWQNLLARIGSGVSSQDRQARFGGRGLTRQAVQLGLQVALVLSALAFGGPISRGVLKMLHAFAAPFEEWFLSAFGWQVEGLMLFEVSFWVLFSLALLIPCIAIWRSLKSISAILADGLLPESSGPDTLLKQAIARSIQVAGLFVFVLLGGAVFPQRIPATGRSLFFIALIALLARLLRTSLLRWHSRVQEGIKAQVDGPNASQAPESAAPNGSNGRLEQQAASNIASDEWSLHVREIRLPPQSQAAGRTIQETGLRRRFGCSIVAIDRRGMTNAHPSASTRLYPDDSLLLVGTGAQLEGAADWLSQKLPEASSDDSLPFEELTTESITVPVGFSQAGRTLAELEIARRFQVMVLGVEHDGVQSQNPAGDQRIEPGDRLLVLGFPGKNRDFHDWFESGGDAPPLSA